MRPTIMLPVAFGIFGIALFLGACAPQTAGKTGPGAMNAEVIKKFEERLAKKVNAEFLGAPLSEFIDFFQSVSEVGMIMDPAVRSNGELPITVSVKDRPLGELLDKVLDQVGLRREYRDGAILITSK